MRFEKGISGKQAKLLTAPSAIAVSEVGRKIGCPSHSNAAIDPPTAGATTTRAEPATSSIVPVTARPPGSPAVNTRFAALAPRLAKAHASSPDIPGHG